MIIRNMFAEDINRSINGVVQVEQSAEEVLWDEIREYVITRELKKHFMTFFTNYSAAFDTPTNDMGVWISGFFGSGKSHFLKMLSYILANQTINGKPTVEWFRDKFAEDPATFMLIDKSTRGQTETILFNIDIESSIQKDKTAVLRVFAKMFYNHLGYYGENLKVAKLEQFIDRQGKTEAFRAAFEARNGSSWLESRDAYAFFQDDIVDTLVEVLGMSESAALNWFDGSEMVDTSIAQLVSEIKDYVSSKPKNFRLLFMIDEVGQYVGTDTDMLLNLQSIIEKLGSECGGKVWVVCTGQEAIDEIIKVRADEFSRIQARFKTRLSLSSSSVDEVIQKRILKKKPEAATHLEALYSQNDSVLRNLFSFANTVMDIKGFSGPREFSENFPFVPYQFIIMQKVFAEIRKHGNSGKHLSGGERSMLSGFQEAAQKMQERDEYALVPFFRFYDTVHGFLDSSIRRVIERCERAAASSSGVEPKDVDVLKLLYLIRYIDDIKSTLDNIVILMADDIRTDKISLRAAVAESLDRLMNQNYIARTGDCYNFLTDEEQDIQKEIRATHVDTVTIVSKIGQMLFGDIYPAKKFRTGIYDFPFDSYVDGVSVGTPTGNMILRFLTVATDTAQKNDLQLMAQSKDKEAIIVLADTPYYESLENAMKIRKYVKQRNITQLAKSVQDIIRTQNDEATKLEQAAATELRKAIEAGTFYADGEKLDITTGDSKNRIEQVLDYLVSHLYHGLELITHNVSSDVEIIDILRGNANDELAFGMQHNQGAADRMEEYLEMQATKRLPTSMQDIQSRYGTRPYGWREIDIAAVTAKLIFEQRVTIKYAGATIQPTDPKLPDMLRKKSEIGKTSISKRIEVSAQKMKQVREFLQDYFDVMSIPADEDGLVSFIVKRFSERKAYLESLLKKYDDKHKYPDRSLLMNAIMQIDKLLPNAKDNITLIDYILAEEDRLFDIKESLSRLEAFFVSQVDIFNRAVDFMDEKRQDQDLLNKTEEIYQALNTIRLILMIPSSGKYDYKRIPELNGLMAIVRSYHDKLLEERRKELRDAIGQCLSEIHDQLDYNLEVKDAVVKADDKFEALRQRVADERVIAMMDNILVQITDTKDKTLELIEILKQPKPSAVPVSPATSNTSPVPFKPARKNYKSIHRQVIFPAKKLETEADIDAYVEKIRAQLTQYMKGWDGIDLK